MNHAFIANCTKTFLSLACLTFMSASANAAYIQIAPDQQPNDGEITLPPTGFTATYSPTAPVSSIWFDSTISPQRPESIAASILQQFGGTLSLADQNDSFSGGSLTVAGGFDVLAIHLGGAGGGNELLFFFSTAITSFDVDTFSQGGSSNISNFRAYNSSVIPVPAAMWLLGSALLGIAGMRRR